MRPYLLYVLHVLNFVATWHSLVDAKDPVDPLARGISFVSLNTTTPTQRYVVAINIVPETGDIFWHMSAPAAVNSTVKAFSWMGVGFGSQMKDTFMLIAYPSGNGSGVTLSPRFARGHSEPSHMEDVKVEKIFSDAYAPSANTVTGGIMIAHAVCRNCTTKLTRSFNLTSKAQPFIYALGADSAKGHVLRSDDLAANLKRHSFYGHFEADMTYATSSPDHGRVPHPNDPSGSPSGVADTNFAFAFASATRDTHKDSDWAPALHGVTMSLAFVLFFPAGTILIRLLRNMGFLFHAGIQVLGMALVFVGFGAAVYVSREYNRSRGFASGHQILGLFVFAALFVQVGLGLLHHRIYVRTKRPTVLGVVHRFLGSLIIILGVINGGLGLSFAGDLHYALAYGIIVAVFAVLFFSVLGIEIICRGPKQYKPEPVQRRQTRSNDISITGFLPETPEAAHEMSFLKRGDY